MSFQDSDISWQVLGRIVKDWAGDRAELAEVQGLDGGVINTTLRLVLNDGQRAVLKISPHRVNRDYEREAYQLDLLRSLGIPAPKVYRLECGSLDDPHSFILLEFMDGMDLMHAKKQCESGQFDELQRALAEVMLAMHRQTAEDYRRVNPLAGDGFANWVDFFRHVYDPIVHEVQKNMELPVKSRKQIGKVHEHLDRLIQHADVPRLVHWDVWSNNLLAAPNGDGNWKISAVLDPNCKFAHAEAEIAYMDLFHTCTPAFLKAYQAGMKLDEGYHRVRKPVYQLYSLLDHVNLFGHEYVKPMLAALEKVEKL